MFTSVTNDNGGTLAPSGLTVHVRNGSSDVAGSPQPGNASGTEYTLAAGSYAVAADAVAGYSLGDCAVSLAVGDAKSCTVTANDNAVVRVIAAAAGDPQVREPAAVVGEGPRQDPGRKKFVLINDGQQVPLGKIVDVRKGRVT